MIKRIITIAAILIIAISLSAQFRLVDGSGNTIVKDGKTLTSSGPVQYYSPPSAAGLGKILWWQDFNSLSTDTNVDNTEAASIMGTYTAQYGFGDGGDDILDNGANGPGDHYFQGHMVPGPGGGISGYQFIKSLRSDEGEPLVGSILLNDLKEVWQVTNVRYESGFSPPGGLDGKAPGGLRGSYAFMDYVANLPPNTKEDFEDGFLVRKYFHPLTPSYHFYLMYWKDMTTDYGNSQSVWSSDYPGSTGIPFDGNWHQSAIRLVLSDNPPDSTDAFVEGYLDELLVSRSDTIRFAMDDSVMIDWALWAWLANNGATVTYPWHCDIDNLGLRVFTDGDSTLTGAERSPGGIYDLPGWPPEEDTASWPTY